MAPTVRSSTRAKTIRIAKTTRTQYKKKKKQQKQLVEQPKIDNVEKTSSSSVDDLPSSTSCTTTATTATSTSDNFSKTIGDDHHQGLDTFDQASADDNNNNNIPTSGCSTPKAQKFRIPEIVTCPPPPKKQRVVSNCSLQRTPIAFFAPPDLELFFFCALHDISV